ncbi:MAG: NAD(P)-dependent oxidoreductase [Bacteroidota bacterium]
MSTAIKAIILGGTGLLGKALAKKMVSHGVSVDLAGRKEALNGFGFLQLDALTCDDYKFLKEYDIVIDCLGQVTNPITDCAFINTTAALRIAKAVAGTKVYYVKISSLAVYGSAELVDETTPCNPDSAYGALKLASENIVAELLKPGNLLNIRLSNLYSDAANKGVIAYLKREYNGNKSIFFDNDGSLLRYYIHVDDAVDIIDNLIFGTDPKNTGTINLPGPEKYTVKELIAVAEAALNISYGTSFKKSDFVWGNIQDISTEKLASHTTLQYQHTISDYFKKIASS